MKLATIGIHYDRSGPPYHYWGTSLTVHGEKTMMFRTEDVEGDLIDALQKAHLDGNLLILSQSIEEYENAVKGVQHELG